MHSNLMTSRRFAPLFWTQFLSAFNDNFLKNSLVMLIQFHIASSYSGALTALAGAVFILPFVVLSALGGELADRYDKAEIAVRLKKAEIIAAALSVVGLAVSSIVVSMLALFLFGVISALFGPIKYGILPDHLETKELPRANAWIEGATFMAILAGTIVAGLASMGAANKWLFGVLMMTLAVACWWAARQIPKTGSKAPDLTVDRNIFRSTWVLLNEVRHERKIWRASLMSSWFWLVGAVILALLPVMVKEVLGGAELANTAYLMVFALSIGVGSAIAAWMSAGRIVLLPAPVGTFLMALCGLDLAWTLWGMHAPSRGDSLASFFSGEGTIRVAVDLAGIAIAGAFIVVPSFSAIQSWAAEDRRARVVGAANLLSAAFIAIGSGILAALQAVGLSVPTLLLGLAAINVLVAWLMLVTLPTNPFRDFISILFRAFLRLEVEGLENLRKAGKAPILALNHVSFLDGALALTLTDEEPVFAVDYKISQAWWAKPFLNMCKFLPLDPSKPMATRSLIKAVNGGDPLVIFPEGRITVTGSLMKVYDGAAMVADKTSSMVVPIRIDGLEKSYFSRLTASHVRRRLFPKVKVTILPAEMLEIDPALKGRQRRIAAGAALYQIMSMLLFRTENISATVVDRVIKAANERGMSTLAVEDALTGKLTYGKLLTATRVLGSTFQRLFAKENVLGVMLPNANGTVATILGLMSAGKIPAMINFTAGSANILAACRAAKITHILTSRAFVTQGKLGNVIADLENDVNFVWMDDLRGTIGTWEKLKGALLKKKIVARCNPDSPAVILFTSGSEGTPKGVVLTHRNILSNTAQAASRIDFHPGDKVFNVLPVFHSFGLTAGTVLPLISGVPIYLYPSPLHYRIIPELIYGSNSTIIFGTDTFLNGYAKTAHPYDFRSLRYCFAGAEPVKASTREIFMEKFGLRILEGYGVTETAPVISLNTPMFNRSGTVGKIFPGMEYRLEPVAGIEEGGRLYLRGDNVMAGYLRTENPGVIEPPVDGWHDTGDIVDIDADGFIRIKGRAKRFAKIAGEMVSFSAVEALAGELWPGKLSAVAAVPDARKGERLILLTDAEGASREQFVAFARSKGAMDIMVPSEVRVGTVPVLGSGKIDFVGVKKMITETPKGVAA